jgi:hypothetical protein
MMNQFVHCLVARNLPTLDKFDELLRRKFRYRNHRQPKHKAVGNREPVKGLYDAAVLSEFVSRIVPASVWRWPSRAGVDTAQ